MGGGPPDAYGYSHLLLGAWRLQWQGFSAVAFDPDLLSRVTPQLVPEETDEAAQIRIRVADLTETELSQ